MGNTFKLKLFGKNEILPGKRNTIYTCEVYDDKLLFKTKNQEFTLYYNFFSMVELGIYKRRLLFQCSYHTFGLAFSLSRKTWKSDAAIKFLQNVNKFTMILDPIKYYKTMNNPLILFKKDTALTKTDVIKQDIETFMNMSDFDTNLDKQIMVINLKSFLIKNSLEDPTCELEDEEVKEMLNDIITSLEKINDKQKGFEKLLITELNLLETFSESEKESNDIYKKVKEYVDYLLENDNDLYARIKKCDYLYFINFQKNEGKDAKLSEVNMLLNELKEIEEETNSYHFTLDYCSVLANLFTNPNKDLIKDRELELINDLIEKIEKIIKVKPIAQNYSVLGFALSLKSEYYIKNKDLIETKNTLLKQKDVILKALELEKAKTKKDLPIMDKKALDYVFELGNVYTSLCNVASEYKNDFEQLKYLREAIQIHDTLIIKKYYKENEEKKVMSLLHEYNYFITLALQNNYEDLPFVGACIMRYYTLTKEYDEKDKDDKNAKIKDHLIQSVSFVIKLIVMSGASEEEKIKYLQEMIKAADKLEKLEPENKNVYDAKAFAYYSFFKLEKSRNKDKATAFAKLTLENINKVDKALLEYDEYQEIIEDCNNFLQ